MQAMHCAEVKAGSRGLSGFSICACYCIYLFWFWFFLFAHAGDSRRGEGRAAGVDGQKSQTSSCHKAWTHQSPAIGRDEGEGLTPSLPRAPSSLITYFSAFHPNHRHYHITSSASNRGTGEEETGIT